MASAPTPETNGERPGATIRAAGVFKSFRKGRGKVEVLKDLNLEVSSGEFLAVMGPSGTGKTTLLNLLSGLDRLDSGTIEIGGEQIESMSLRQLGRWRALHVGLVFQISRLLPMLTAQRNVELPLALTDLGRKARKRHVAAALELVGLTDRARHYPRELSGGQEQRVGIARAIVTDPTLLICDEPTGDLDRETGDEILRLLKALANVRGKTIVMVTHDVAAAAMTDRTLHLHEGRLHETPMADATSTPETLA